ncbi:MAG: hypothetical protein HQK89_03285 [Nitrospirae bacterium]|nr:hypothetical protein [Nitrospirota bacterium]
MEKSAGGNVPLPIDEEPVGKESIWKAKRTALFDKLYESREGMNAYRDNLLIEKQKLRDEIDLLEGDNRSMVKEIKEIEIQILEKSGILKKLVAAAGQTRKKLIKPMTDESSLTYELRFLESEKASLIDKYDTMSAELSEHINTLGNTILSIDFMKGEIETLREKILMVEKEVPQYFVELDLLEEKITWTSNALTELYKAMKNIEKKTKLLYYTKR